MVPGSAAGDLGKVPGRCCAPVQAEGATLRPNYTGTGVEDGVRGSEPEGWSPFAPVICRGGFTAGGARPEQLSMTGVDSGHGRQRLSRVCGSRMLRMNNR